MASVLNATGIFSGAEWTGRGGTERLALTLSLSSHELSHTEK